MKYYRNAVCMYALISSVTVGPTSTQQPSSPACRHAHVLRASPSRTGTRHGRNGLSRFGAEPQRHPARQGIDEVQPARLAAVALLAAHDPVLDVLLAPAPPCTAVPSDPPCAPFPSRRMWVVYAGLKPLSQMSSQVEHCCEVLLMIYPPLDLKNEVATGRSCPA